MDSNFYIPQWSIPYPMTFPPGWVPGMYPPPFQFIPPLAEYSIPQPQLADHQPRTPLIPIQSPYTPNQNGGKNVYQSPNNGSFSPPTDMPILTLPSDKEVSSVTPIESVKSQRGKKRKRKETMGDEMCQPTPPSSSPSNPSNELINKEEKSIMNVCGRLCVVGAQKTYSVTDVELIRRTSDPEFLNISHIGTLLRKGKVKNSSGEIKRILEQIGATVNYEKNLQISRNKCPLSTLSSLLEGEATQLSRDHRELALSHFPFVYLARMEVSSIPTPLELSQAMSQTKAAIKMMTELMDVIEEWTRSNEAVISSKFYPFFLVTHGLGTKECINHGSIFLQYLSILNKELEAHSTRVNSTIASNPQYIVMNQMNKFPPGVEVPDSSSWDMTTTTQEDCHSKDAFSEVSGRLSLSGSKYTISLGEIYRRIRPPESLNLSILGSALRKGKSKDNGNSLRDHLASFGIKIDQGRRKSAKITLFTSLVEAEAQAIAFDIEREAINYFPKGPLVDALLKRTETNNGEDIDMRKKGLLGASHFLKSIVSTLRLLELSIADRVVTNPHKKSSIMLNYSSLTHGYGPDACISWFNIFDALFEDAAQALPQ